MLGAVGQRGDVKVRNAVTHNRGHDWTTHRERCFSVWERTWCLKAPHN
jgi:hypothetical protein